MAEDDLETRPDSPGEPGMQPRDPCLPWRGKLGPGYKKYAYRSVHDYGSRAAQMESKIQTFD